MEHNGIKTGFIVRKSLSMLFKNKTSVLSSLVYNREGSLYFHFPIPVIKRGKGQFIYDYDGNRYIDFYLSGGDLLLGHSHPQVTKILKGWLGRGYGACYPQVGLEMLVSKIENTFLCNSGEGSSSNRKWFFFPSYESLLVVLQVLGESFNGRNGKVYYFFSDKYSDITGPNLKIDLKNNNKKEGVDRSDAFKIRSNHLFLKNVVGVNLDKLSNTSSAVSEINSIKNSLCLFEFHPLSDLDFQLKVLDVLRNHRNFLISVERRFYTFLFIHENPVVSGFFDGRAFGNWVAAGLPVVALFFNDFSRLAGSRINIDCIIENIGRGLWIPPLYLIKGTIRITYLINKLGGLKKYIEKGSYFYSFLDADYFSYNSGCICIRKNYQIWDNWKNIYFSLLRNGIFFSPQMNHPLYISLVHEDEALKKYAKKINLTFRMDSR